MSFNRKFLIFGILIILISLTAVYSIDNYQNTNDLTSIYKNINATDEFGCCSIVLQIDDNHSMITFRRDSSFDADIHIEKVKWYDMPVIMQYKEDEGYFSHVIITNDGWMIGMGGVDEGFDSKKCENITAHMINENYTIDKAALKEIQKIKKPYGRGHVVIKAPNGNYGFVNVDKLKTGKLDPGRYISIPNNYSLSRSGNLSLDSDDLIKDMTELSQLDKYGQGRRNIITYDYYSGVNNNTTDIYLSNDDGSRINESYENDVDDVYFKDLHIIGSDIPIGPDYMSLGSFTFTDNDDLPREVVIILYVIIAIFIIMLFYGVSRFVRFIKSRVRR